jgi:hypothetical protein
MSKWLCRAAERRYCGGCRHFIVNIAQPYCDVQSDVIAKHGEILFEQWFSNWIKDNECELFISSVGEKKPVITSASALDEAAIKAIVESAGGIYHGLQQIEPGVVDEVRVWFSDPKTRSTLLIPVADLTAEQVIAALERKRSEFKLAQRGSMKTWLRTADDQLKMGIEVEKEHAGTYKWIKDTYEKTGKWPEDQEVFSHIGQDHLKEIKDYYTRLKNMEDEAKMKKQSWLK